MDANFCEVFSMRYVAKDTGKSGGMCSVIDTVTGKAIGNFFSIDMAGRVALALSVQEDAVKVVTGK